MLTLALRWGHVPAESPVSDVPDVWCDVPSVWSPLSWARSLLGGDGDVLVTYQTYSPGSRVLWL